MISFPDLVIFDCDGVLVDSEVLASRVVSETLGKYGVNLSAREVADKFAGYTDEAIRNHFCSNSEHKLPDNFAQIVEETTISYIPEQLKTLPYIKETLANIRYDFCVASNSRTNRLNSAIDATGLSEFFPSERRFSSSLVQHPKPAPDLHLLACSQMGVSPDQALVIEDTFTGVSAAVAAGISVFGFVGAEHITDTKAQSSKLIDAGAIAVFDDMRQLNIMLRDYSAA
ncbi:HAD family hydrolase [Kiloniella sp.]|uniref:HAD family hydrolase n=1 Tax=Kiloniella sp. TaxID=1938587 RepID=UPI003B02492D